MESFYPEEQYHQKSPVNVSNEKSIIQETDQAQYPVEKKSNEHDQLSSSQKNAD